ncbi:uncharacterized protein LOC141629897 [Silene latifolia]|uniref:uncharacterized protein LOC141629897 n=1 Tax=Silene latifolia TaxID=37657 RepID=UPI003D774509
MPFLIGELILLFVNSFLGPLATWANKRDSQKLILERLDRGYASQDWLLSYPKAHIQNLNIFLSDHAPILLHLSQRLTKPKRPYRVDIWCLNHSEIQCLVSSIWQRFSTVPVASSVTMKLSLIRSSILKWVLLNRHQFMLDWSSFSQNLSASSSRIHDSKSASDYFRHLSFAEHDVHAQHSFWKQRAKSDFKFNDGLPTAYFFSRAKARQKRLLLQDLPVPKLDSFQQDYLSQPFTANDVEKAFFDMQPNKSPGPDGFPPKFYHLFWHTIHEDITSAVLGFLNSASKCIALRLRKITESIIGQNQNAFLPGRLISDSGFLAHELLSYINQRRRGTRCFGALKLDMNKAFDRVSWPFLFHVLKLFDFPKAFRRLLKSCVRTTSLQVLINGSPSARIFPHCGLRQGDPISPYLFILCMEILSLMVIKAESQRSIEGIKLSRNSPAISHLLYADDALLCFHLSSSSCESLRDILISFGNISGQMINHQKSYIKFSPNTPDDFREHVTNILKVPSKQNFGLYLGAPIDLGRKKTSAFQFILDKISTKILSWGAANFSQASKLLLINSILMASIAHVASILPIPLHITTKLNYLIDLFWWKQSKNKRAQHWLSPEKLQLPKSEGGLGIKNARLFSQAMISKTFWRCHHHQHSLISSVLRNKYPKDFPVPGKVSKYSAASFAWKGVVKNTFLIRDGFAWKFGNGKLINMENDAWILGSKPCFKTPYQAQDFSFADLLLNSTQWNKFNIFNFFKSVSARKICALELPPEPTDDFIYWKYTEDGLFSSSSAYSFLLHNCIPSLASPRSSVTPAFPWVFIWRLPCQPHIKIFLWKLVHGILPTADVLIRRGMSVNPICSLCQKNCETLSHLFRDCDFTQHIWAASHLGIQTNVSSHIPFCTWFQDFLSYITWFSSGDISLPLLFLLTLYAIWKHRNNVIFRDRCVSPAEIISDIALLSKQQHEFSSFSKDQVQSSCFSEVTSLVSSSPHFFSHCFRLEAVFNKHSSLGSFKVYRNGCITHEVLHRFCSSHLQLIIIALIEAMNFASAFRLKDVLFLISSIRLLRLLNDSKKTCVPIALSSSISSIKSFLSCNSTWYCNGYV